MRESFTDREKEILNRVNDTKEHYVLLGNIIDGYLKNMLVKFQLNVINRPVTFVYDANTPGDQVEKNIDDSINLFIEVIGILELFEKEGYIYVYDNSTHDSTFQIGELPVNIEHTEFTHLDLTLQKKIAYFATHEIYRTPALKEFIDNGFKTGDMVMSERSLKYAKWGIIIALIIGLLAFFVDILGVKLFNIFYTILKYDIISIIFLDYIYFRLFDYTFKSI